MQQNSVYRTFKINKHPKRMFYAIHVYKTKQKNVLSESATKNLKDVFL